MISVTKIVKVMSIMILISNLASPVHLGLVLVTKIQIPVVVIQAT